MADGAELTGEGPPATGHRRGLRTTGLVAAALLVVGVLALVPFVALPDLAVWVYALACAILLVASGLLPRRSPWRVLCIAIAVGVALIVGTLVLVDILAFVPDATVDS